MKKPEKEFFTTGEFANLFGISKQTLFYYDKNHIFSPEYIDENGYRYYSVTQFFTFEIISTMRKLDFSLEEIVTYLKYRNMEKLKQLFLEKTAVYQKQLHLLESNIQNIAYRNKLLECAQGIHSEQFHIEDRPAESILVTHFPKPMQSHKNYIQILAAHYRRAAQPEHASPYLFGYMIKNPQTNTSLQISNIFSPSLLPANTSSHTTKPGGKYAVLYQPNSSHLHYREGAQRLLTFINKQNHTAYGPLYILPLCNYWSSTDIQHNITEISIALK